MATPTSDNDWKIHALNVHGGFFEQKVSYIINNFNPKKLHFITSEYPVEVSHEESRLDVLGFIPYILSEGNGSGIFLTIECKKHNPELNDWIFYPKIQNLLYGEDYSQCSFLKTYPSTFDDGVHARIELSERRYSDKPISGDCREVRGTYKDVSNGIKTKTSNSSITDASYQVTLATHSIVNEHVKLLDENIKKNNTPSYTVNAYIPIIVTTANLFLLDYKLTDIDSKSGEISFDNAKLQSVDWLWYEYPVPPHLQMDIDIDFSHKTTNIKNLRKYDFAVRRNILIVNSAQIEVALAWLIQLQHSLFG